MTGHLRRLMSMQHWPDDIRRLTGAASARTRQDHIRPFADGQTLVEALGLEAVEAHRVAWRDLAQRAIEPNPFLEADFAMSAALHLPAGQRPEFVTVWQGVGFEPRARLIGLWALEPRRVNLLRDVGRAWSYRHAALGTPLVDRFAGVRAVDAMLGWLSRRRLGQATLAIPALIQSGPLFALLVDRCAVAGLSWTTLNEHDRAILRPGATVDQALARARSNKHRREIDRLARRLGEQGAVTSETATSAEDVRRATEYFLAIEQKGWKGRRGSAFLSDVGDAVFLRSTVRLLARAGKCRIDSISLDGLPIAMGIVLVSGDRAYFWKTTYDETFAHFSPGVHLARALMERQLGQAGIVATDSCAIADHPMIDRVWPDRQRMADMLISVDPLRRRAFPLVAGRERLQRRLRAALKSAANSALRRRVS